jgi:hypothetical protein
MYTRPVAGAHAAVPASTARLSDPTAIHET